MSDHQTPQDRPPVVPRPSETASSTVAPEAGAPDQQGGAAPVHPASGKGQPPEREQEASDSGVAKVLAPTKTRDEILHPEKVARLAMELSRIAPEDKPKIQALFQGVDRKEVAKMLAEQGIPEGMALKLLETAYGIDRDAAREITASDELRTKFDANTEPAPESDEDRERRENMERAIEEDFGPQLGTLMDMEDKEEQKKGFQKLIGRLQGMFDNDGMRALGGVLRFSIKGIGIIGLILMLLMKMYGGGGGK